MTSKEVLEYLKELSTYELFLDNIRIKEKTSRQIIKSAIYQLEKQQKEIKKEKNRIMELAELLDKQENEIKFLKGELEIQESCYISKDKIRAKIKDYDQWIKEGGDYTESLEAQKYVLQELLEEN